MKITKRQLRQIVAKAINEGRDTNLAMLYSPPGDGSLDTLTTDQVKFEYGMYTGRKFKDVPYYISIDSEQELGEIQRRGDPYTYTASGAGKMKVVSGPARDTLAARKWMGALVKNPDTQSFAAAGGVFTEPTPPVASDTPEVDPAVSAQADPRAANTLLDNEPTPTPTPTRRRDKKYSATKEQIADFGMKLSKHRSLHRTQRRAYRTMSMRVKSGEMNKDSALETFVTTPSMTPAEIKPVMIAAGIK